MLHKCLSRPINNYKIASTLSIINNRTMRIELVAICHRMFSRLVQIKSCRAIWIIMPHRFYKATLVMHGLLVRLPMDQLPQPSKPIQRQLQGNKLTIMVNHCHSTLFKVEQPTL